MIEKSFLFHFRKFNYLKVNNLPCIFLCHVEIFFIFSSLLKVHLQLRGFSVFIDVERLEAGKFDNNLLNSIRQAKHFLLVLTPNALERCTEDIECKDWVHKVIFKYFVIDFVISVEGKILLIQNPRLIHVF